MALACVCFTSSHTNQAQPVLFFLFSSSSSTGTITAVLTTHDWLCIRYKPENKQRGERERDNTQKKREKQFEKKSWLVSYFCFHGRTLASCYWRRFSAIAWPLIITPNSILVKEILVKGKLRTLHCPPICFERTVHANSCVSSLYQVLHSIHNHFFGSPFLVFHVRFGGGR